MPSRGNWLRVGHRRAITGFLLLAGLACAAAGQAPAPPAGQAAPVDPLLTLNNAFRAGYQRTKESTLAHGGPVILVEGDKVVLRRGNARQEAAHTPAIYHVLKAVAHVPLALDVMLAPHAGDATLDEAVLAELRQIRSLMEDAEPSLATRGLEPEQLDRARTIFAESRKFLDAVVQARCCSRERRIAFARRMTPMVMKNVGDASRAELDALHSRVIAWRKEMSADEWTALKVVILGSALPRKQNEALQYFARLLGEPGEGPRIIYAESVRDEAKALDLLATSEVDTGIGVDFFNDPTRMHRDLLSDAAKDYLPLLIDRP
jgi:hypothetical protein